MSAEILLRFRFRPASRSSLAGALALTLLLVAHGPARSASGDLDPSFGEEGVAMAPFGGSAALAMAVQTDGKIVVAGTATGSDVLAVARFDSAGVLDPSFGSGGMVTTDIGPFDDTASQVMIHSDDTIVVVGTSQLEAGGIGGDLVVVRYLPDGSLDGSFGSGGIVTRGLGASQAANAGALQTDGKIVVVGGALSTSAVAADLFAVRYLTTGLIDEDFGTDGVATLDFGGRADSGTAVAIQTDGMIIVAGSSFDGPLFLDGSVASLSRFDTDGVPDPGFGTGGSVVLDADPLNVSQSLVIQPDGKIVLLAATGTGNVSFRLFRFDDAGVPDGGFVGAPVGVFPQSGNPGALALLPDGKFAVVGNGLVVRFNVVRMNADGSVDTTFGDGGSILLAVGRSGSSFAAAAGGGTDILLVGAARPQSAPQPDNLEATVVRVQGSSAACSSDADCDVCERCGGGGFCEIGARSGCTDAASRKGLLKVRKKFGAGDRLKVQWRGVVPSFDPTISDDLGVCVYADGGRVLKAVAPAGGLCAGQPCWTTTSPTNFEYDDEDETPHGISRIQVKADRIKLDARGLELATSPQGVPDPFALGESPSAPVVMQLHAGNGACVEATFDARRKVRPSSFTGKTD